MKIQVIHYIHLHFPNHNSSNKHNDFAVIQEKSSPLWVGCIKMMLDSYKELVLGNFECSI